MTDDGLYGDRVLTELVSWLVGRSCLKASRPGKDGRGKNVVWEGG